jgi:hypothetical protein
MGEVYRAEDLEPNRSHQIPTRIGIQGVVALGAWGFYLSLAGKPLWKDELLE